MTTLPNFLVIGAYKSATTSLYHYLRQHPQVFVPEVKEPNYLAFADHPDPLNPAYQGSVKTLEEYERLFESVTDEEAIGDVSPEYMSNPHACNAIRMCLPDAKLIAILRNPVERAYSDYLMYVRDGREKADFNRALDEQEERFGRGDPTGYYVRTGFYGAQLEPYYASFPRDQIKILLYEELAADSGAPLRQLFSFLGVQPDFRPADLTAHNRAVQRNAFVERAIRIGRPARTAVGWLTPPRWRASLQRVMRHLLYTPQRSATSGDWLTARERLLEIYREDIARLGELIQRDLSHWLA